MRLLTFARNGAIRLGALGAGGRQVIDLNRADPDLPSDLITLLASGASGLARAQRALEQAAPEATVALGELTLKPPILHPGKIICIGQNYAEHAAESNAAVSPYPIIFAKYPNALIAGGDPIILPKLSAQVDYEGELAVVIGTRAKNVAEGEALAYVGGYAPFNDVSARDFQARTSQWTIGKTFDTFGPMGPTLTTADEVPDPQNLSIRLSIGGEILQSSRTSKMIFPVATLIAYLSSVMTLEPGDIIATGTPDGVGAARTPQRFLRPGDTVRVEIEGLDVLENPVLAEA
jgi:2-keto-4-pentenoate hydratase/2-oxohepta-3-ene-1,7-dioic acid hydratase in catechol pathway